MEIINQVLLPAVNNSLTTAALLAAQVLAGMCKFIVKGFKRHIIIFLV